MFILKLEFEEKILESHIDRMAVTMPKLQNANLIATAMAYFQRYYLHKTLFQTDPDKIE